MSIAENTINGVCEHRKLTLYKWKKDTLFQWFPNITAHLNDAPEDWLVDFV